MEVHEKCISKFFFICFKLAKTIENINWGENYYEAIGKFNTVLNDDFDTSLAYYSFVQTYRPPNATQSLLLCPPETSWVDIDEIGYPSDLFSVLKTILKEKMTGSLTNYNIHDRFKMLNNTESYNSSYFEIREDTYDEIEDKMEFRCFRKELRFILPLLTAFPPTGRLFKSDS